MAMPAHDMYKPFDECACEIQKNDCGPIVLRHFMLMIE